MSEYQGKRFKPSQVPDPAQPASEPYRADVRPEGAQADYAAAHARQRRARQAADRAQAPQPVTPSGYGRGSHGGKAPKPKGTKRRRRILPMLLMLIGIGLIIAAAGIFIMAEAGYKEATDTYDTIGKQYASTVTEVAGEEIPNPNFDELAAVNPDVVGWIYVPGTTINYPVVQTTNNKKYLNTLFNGKANASGAIFMDADDTAPGVVDQQTTLYGHHMNNGGMFNPIADTANQDSFDAIKNVYYITRDATYRFTPLLTHVVDGSSTEPRTPNFGEDGSLASYLRKMLSGADAKASDAESRIDSTQQVITLITCKRDVLANGRACMICTLAETTPRQ